MDEAKTKGNNSNEENITESTAVRPHHRQKRLIAYDKRNDSTFKTRNILNLLFMLFAVIGLVVYVSSEGMKTLALVLILIGVVLKIVEVGIRLFHK